MKPKKSLGQNFLTDETLAQKIVESADLSSKDNVIEIGPGKGILTKYLAQCAKKVLAIEIDADLAEKLGKFNLKNTKVITEDILKINLPKLIEENDFLPYRVVANLPYYITSKIIRLFLETKYPPIEMIFMVQKEVGNRISAKPGQESILSISVKFYAESEILFDVSRENFNPAPEVDSTVIRIKRKKNPPKVETSKFFSIVRAGFSSKRKMLVNNLSSGFNLPKDKVSEILKKAGIEPTQRAQELALENWLDLYKKLKF
jgi:16S rRNA (adenine1518-N6/adenine1519-N6)-dimethyltransferase